MVNTAGLARSGCRSSLGLRLGRDQRLQVGDGRTAE
jgi:hypothetical protein